MECMSCDHQFGRDESPPEVMFASPWAKQAKEALIMPVCAACAQADPETKTARMRAHCSKLAPGARLDFSLAVKQ